ncbi:MAG: hemerythrin domain-containing protein, partial [Planctomycetota bacterium]
FLDLEKHMAEEEEWVFPAIRRQQDGLTSALKALSADHESAGRVLLHIDLMTSDCVPPHHACTTWKALYLGLSAFKKDLMDHVHLEEHVLFPRQSCRVH